MKKFFCGFFVGTIVALTSTVFAAYNTQTIDAVFGKVKVFINGVAMQQETLLYNGSTYVPLRAAGEALNMSIYYDSGSNTAYFNSQTTTTTKNETTTKAETTTESTTATKNTTAKSDLPKIPSSRVVLSKYGSYFEGRFDFKVISDNPYSDYYEVECAAVGELRGNSPMNCCINFYDSEGYLIDTSIYIIRGSGAVKTKSTVHFPKNATKYKVVEGW